MRIVTLIIDPKTGVSPHKVYDPNNTSEEIRIDLELKSVQLIRPRRGSVPYILHTYELGDTA
mgnify:CR=1 FL=1